MGYILSTRIFKNSWFTRFAQKEAISDGELRETVGRLEKGQADADLGGGVYKQRIARPGAGKSGGYRVIVFFRNGGRAFFVYGFAKSDRGSINSKQRRDFKVTAKTALNYTEGQLDELVKNNWFTEI